MTAWLQQDFEAMDGRDADTMIPAEPVRYRKALRVRKARATSTCPHCGRLIIRGERIASRDGGPFGHLGHFPPDTAKQAA